MNEHKIECAQSVGMKCLDARDGSDKLCGSHFIFCDPLCMHHWAAAELVVSAGTVQAEVAIHVSLAFTGGELERPQLHRFLKVRWNSLWLGRRRGRLETLTADRLTGKLAVLDLPRRAFPLRCGSSVIARVMRVFRDSPSSWHASSVCMVAESPFQLVSAAFSLEVRMQKGHGVDLGPFICHGFERGCRSH